MRQSTKAQIQMGEMMAVMFVFLILLIFGIYWFFTQGAEQAGDLREEQFRLDLLEKTKEIMSLPEIQCSFAATPDSTCVDAYRVESFRQKIGPSGEFTREYQERFFGQAVRIEIIYPEQERFPQRINLFNFTPETHSGFQPAFVPITLYDPLTERSYLAMLILENYDLTPPPPPRATS